MAEKSTARSEVLRAIESIENHVQTAGLDGPGLAAALIEAGLRAAAKDARQAASAAERKLIRAHHPHATDDDIDALRVAPPTLRYMLDLLTTAARKYVDYQPEACTALDACPDDKAVADFVAVISRHQQNAYAGPAASGLSAYDVAAATITNASILASEHGVCLEQLATIHLEGIQRALAHKPMKYGGERI